MTALAQHSPAMVVAHLIRQESGGLVSSTMTGSWPLYVCTRPNSPDALVCLTDTLGPSERRTMAGTQVDHPGLQLMVRGASNDPRTPYQKIAALVNWLENLVTPKTIVVDGVTYVLSAIHRRGNILPMGQAVETDRRFLYSANYITTFKES